MIKLKRPVWLAVLIISILILLAGAVFLFWYFTQQDAPPPMGEITASTSETVILPDDLTEAPAGTAADSAVPATISASDSYGYQMEYSEDWLNMSLEEINEINPDIYAWIYIPGTNVDYPVAQSLVGDDSFYLSHNIYGSYQFSGTIYSQSMNRTDFRDPVTVLYGHNMLNGSMFASLHYFEDASFFNEHNTCFVRTKDKLLTYLIYSAYVYDDRHIMNSFNFNDEQVLLGYFDSTLNPRTYSGNVRQGVTLDSDSRVLTLSTCTNGSSNTRYLVQGVLVDEQLR